MIILCKNHEPGPKLPVRLVRLWPDHFLAADGLISRHGLVKAHKISDTASLLFQTS